jgi:hypothetical protein
VAEPSILNRQLSEQSTQAKQFPASTGFRKLS